jgi:hypothetical protein
VAEQAQRLQARADAPDTTGPALGEELRALALISLGSTESWVARFEETERHLDQGVTLARRIGRPYLEFTGLAYQAAIEFNRSFALAVERGRQAVELAERHGWTDEPAAGFANLIVGGLLVWQGRLEEAEPWIQRGEQALRAEAEPAAGLAIRCMRGLLELARGRDADALAAFQAGDRLAERLAEPNLMVPGIRSFLVQTLVGLGETERAEQYLGGRSGPRARGYAHQRGGAAAGAGRPTRGGRRARAGSRRLRADTLAGLAGTAVPAAGDRPRQARRPPRLPLEPLSDSEIRVLRCLATNLTAAEIARRADCLTQHGQDPHQPRVCQAWHAYPGRGCRPRPGAGPAGPLRAAGPGHASWLTAVVGLTSGKVPGRVECGAGILGRSRDGRRL